jgi:predicted 3-demethylubiquinone-9 3-methyltransferase (glyoxalase superfamily)
MKDIYPCLWFDNQAEEAAAGGATQSCGWLKDKYGLSLGKSRRTALQELMRDSNRVMKALLQMGKFDLQGVKNAAAA